MWKSILVGALGLALLETVLTASSAQQGQLGSLLQVPGDWARKFMDPTVPLIPNYAHSTGQVSSGTSTQPSSYTTGPTSSTGIPISAPVSQAPHPSTPVFQTA